MRVTLLTVLLALTLTFSSSPAGAATSAPVNVGAACIRWTGTATWSPCTFYTPWGTATVVTPSSDLLGVHLTANFSWAYGVTCITGVSYSGNISSAWGAGVCSTWAPYGIAQAIGFSTAGSWLGGWLLYGGARYGGQYAVGINRG